MEAVKSPSPSSSAHRRVSESHSAHDFAEPDPNPFSQICYHNLISREFWCDFGGTSFQLIWWYWMMHIGDWKGDVRGEQAQRRANWKWVWGMEDMEHQDWCAASLLIRTSFTLLIDLWIHSDTTHFNSAFDSLWDSHSLEAVSHSSHWEIGTVGCPQPNEDIRSSWTSSYSWKFVED